MSTYVLKEWSHSILIDVLFFPYLVEARIEQIYSKIGAIQSQIRSQFKVAMLQQSRNIRSMKVEEFYYNNVDKANNLDLTVECAKVAVSISNDVNNEVKTTVKGKYFMLLLGSRQSYEMWLFCLLAEM